MHSSDGVSVSAWCSSTPAPPERILDQSLDCEVCIVGAGIAGLSTAWELTRSGQTVVVIDAAYPGAGQTSRSTAHLTTALDDRYASMEEIHGQEQTRLIASSLREAIHQLLRISSSAGFDCGFEEAEGYLIQAPTDPRSDFLRREGEAARRAGVAGVELVAGVPVPGFPVGEALKFPGQSQFDPILFIEGLHRALLQEGCRIFSRTAMEAMERKAGNWIIQTKSGHRITARHVVIATNAPVHHRMKMHTKQSAWRTYVIGMQVPAGNFPRIQIWDTADPYHYVRRKTTRDPAYDLLICGGRDHRTGQAQDFEQRYADLEAWARRHFGSIAGAVTHRWSGQVLEPADGLPFLGRDPGQENVYLITGDSGQGTSSAMIGSMILRDQINGKPNPWEALYDPARKMTQLSPAREFLVDQLNVAVQYSDYLKPGEAATEEQVAPGHGAVVRHGFQKVAVYRDAGGALHRMSAVCPHLGGIVHWNPAEKTWDCPCHGSRFDACGAVVEGPAIQGLSPAATVAKETAAAS